MSPYSRARIALALLAVASLIVLFPLSVRLADPFATSSYNPAIDARVLLLWPDRIELQPIHDLAKSSPRPSNAQYTFLIPPERLAWVTRQLRAYPTPTHSASWYMRVKALEKGDQEIELELLGDGIYGVVYKASEEKILPIGTRLAGPGFALIFLAIDSVGSALVVLIAILFTRLLRRPQNLNITATKA